MNLNLTLEKECDEVQGHVMNHFCLDIFSKFPFTSKIFVSEKRDIRNSVKFSAADVPFGTFPDSSG